VAVLQAPPQGQGQREEGGETTKGNRNGDGQAELDGPGHGSAAPDGTAKKEVCKTTWEPSQEKQYHLS